MRPPIDIVIRKYKVEYTDVYEESYKSTGTLYCFNMRVNNGSKDFVLRITSKNSNFKELYSIDILNKKMMPVKGMEIKSTKGKNSAEIVEKTVECLMNPSSIKQTLKEDAQQNGEDFAKIITIVSALITSFLGLQFLAIKLKNWVNEISSNRAENKLNKELFSSQNGRETDFECYNKLINSIELTIKNPRVKSLIICGIPGTSKTYIVRRTIYFNNLKSGSDYVILKGGTMNLMDFCSVLYKNSNKIIVLDDFDSPLEDKDLVNILKSATDSYGKRIISVPRVKKVQNGGGDDYDLPQKFVFNGKIIIITNKEFKELDKALISRSLTVEVNFSPEEFVDNIQKMLKYIMPNVSMEIKQEVLDYINQQVQKHKITGINFRTFQSAISIRLLYKDEWKPMVDYVLK